MMKKHLRYLKNITRLSLLKTREYSVNFLWFFFLFPFFLASEMLGYYFLFSSGNIQTLAGFSLAEIIFVGSISALVWLSSTIFSPLTVGLVTEQIKEGNLDFIYTKPLHPFLMIWVQEAHLNTFLLWILRIIIVILTIKWGHLILSFEQIGEIVYVFITSLILFHCLFISSESLAFWFPKLNINEYIFECTAEMALYPSSIYPSLFRIFATYILPFFLIANPAFLILKNNYTFYDALLAFGQVLLWIIITGLLWDKGQKHYSSAN